MFEAELNIVSFKAVSRPVRHEVRLCSRGQLVRVLETLSVVSSRTESIASP
jgi:hypothetical protein